MSFQPETINRRRMLLLVALASVIAYFLWNSDSLGFIMYPVRLFVTYVHEAGHALAALLTGGEVLGFAVSANGSGVAGTAGGTRAIILPAGYIGAALFGSLLFYVINRFPGRTEAIAGLLGIGIIVFSAFFARPDGTGVPLALIVGIGVGLGLMFMGWKANASINLVVLNVLAIITALNAFFDIWAIVKAPDLGREGILNDAGAFSQEIMPLVPANVIGLAWAGIALILFGIALWYGVVRPLRQEVDNAYNNDNPSITSVR